MVIILSQKFGDFEAEVWNHIAHCSLAALNGWEPYLSLLIVFLHQNLFPLYHIFNFTVHKFSKGHHTSSFSSPLWPHHMIIIISWFDDYHIMISSHFHYIHLLTISTTLTKYFKDIMLFLHYSIIDERSCT